MEDDFDNWLAERERDQDIPEDGGDVLQPGQRIGAYRILRQLGVGGMGQVYEAEHVALGVKRALKVFSTASEHSEFLRKRFVAEGRILADLQHPRIVRVYDLVVDEDSDMAYFEMDLVLSPNGQPCTLADRLQIGVSEEEIVGWFKDICEGLAYIHSRGVIHRDISLDNILIGRDGRAVITDFGIAKIIDDSYRRKIAVTVTMVYKDGSEVRMGKERYMAPELKKQGGKESFASDAWAVGISLFKMLSGSWYDVGTHLEDCLVNFEYDWYPIVAQLCDVDPKKRLEENGIAAMPALLERKVLPVPFWRRKWVVLNGIAAALFAVAFVSYCFAEHGDAAQLYEELTYDKTLKPNGPINILGRDIRMTHDLEYELQTDSYTGQKSIAIVKVHKLQTDFTIPDKIGRYRVRRIGVGSFSGCHELTSLTIPTGVTSIENNAFASCTELMCVKIPASVTDIGERVFTDCRRLGVFIVASSNQNYKSHAGLLLTKDGKTLIHGVNGDVTIFDGVTRIESEAFRGCSGLAKVKIPTSVTSIGTRAFEDCDGLVSITIPNSMASIGDEVFSGCYRLKSIIIPDNVTSIGKWAFAGCAELTNVTMSANIIDIGKDAFVNTTLKTVYVSAGDTDRVKKLFVDSGHDITDIEFIESKADDS